MEKIRKFAALTLALCTASALLLGCRNEKELSGYMDTVKLGNENAVVLESGEIMVYETFKTERDIADKLNSSVTETYIKFIQDGELSYDFTESEKVLSTDTLSMFEATKENGKTVVTRDGKAAAESEAPDIFGYFDISYDIADVRDISSFEASDRTVYAVTMNDAYAARFDSEVDGVKSSCKRVAYNYYIDSAGVTRSQLSEYTFEVVYGDDRQTVTRFIQATVN